MVCRVIKDVRTQLVVSLLHSQWPLSIALLRYWEKKYALMEFRMIIILYWSKQEYLCAQLCTDTYFVRPQTKVLKSIACSLSHLQKDLLLSPLVSAVPMGVLPTYPSNLAMPASLSRSTHQLIPRLTCEIATVGNQITLAFCLRVE